MADKVELRHFGDKWLLVVNGFSVMVFNSDEEALSFSDIIRSKVFSYRKENA